MPDDRDKSKFLRKLSLEMALKKALESGRPLTDSVQLAEDICREHPDAAELLTDHITPELARKLTVEALIGLELKLLVPQRKMLTSGEALVADMKKREQALKVVRAEKETRLH